MHERIDHEMWPETILWDTIGHGIITSSYTHK